MHQEITAILGLEGFQVTEVIDKGHKLDLKVELMAKAGFCTRCGQVSTAEVKERRLTRVRDLPICGKETYLLWLKRRYRCQECLRSFSEIHAELPSRDKLTRRFRGYLFEKVHNGAAHAEVARIERTSAYQVAKSFGHGASGLLSSDRPAPRRLSLDEASQKKGHRDYVTVVSDLDRGCVIEALKGKGQRVVEDYFASLSVADRESVERVSIDCSYSYRSAVEAQLPHVAIVADHFHLIRALNAALSKVRKNQKVKPYQPATLFDEEPPDWPKKVDLFRNRFKLVKAKEKLTLYERRKLFGILRHLPRLYGAWRLKELFRDVYKAKDIVEAKERLDLFIRAVESTNLTEFSDFLTTVKNWYEEILNYFDEPTTNGYAEGVINKVKVIKRRAYGMPNFENFRSRILVACGDQASLGLIPL